MSRQSRRRIGLIAAALLAVATLAEAQTSVRYYLVPKIGDGLSLSTAFRPKYYDAGSLGAGWTLGPDVQWMDYGAEDIFLLAANLTTTDHTTLSAQPDVIAVPAPITANVAAGAINTIKSKLEGAHLPADWITTSLTYKQVLATLIRIVQFMQRYQGMTHERFFDLVDKTGAAITLDTTFSQLTAAEKTKLQNAATDLGLDTSAIGSTSTIRFILKTVADQLYPPDSIVFGGNTF